MLLRKEQGNCSIGDYVWPHDGAVVEVPDWMGMELLAIKGHDYTEVQPDAEPTPDPDPDPVDDDADEMPTGTAAQVLDWVNAKDTQARAAAALEVERAKGESARSSLVTKLEKLTA